MWCVLQGKKLVDIEQTKFSPSLVFLRTDPHQKGHLAFSRVLHSFVCSSRKCFQVTCPLSVNFFYSKIESLDLGAYFPPCLSGLTVS